MGLFDFVKDAGESLMDKVRDTVGPSDTQVGEMLNSQVHNLGLQADGLQVQFDDGVAKILGTVRSQEAREKIILAVGNTQGVSQVDDRLKVETPEPEAQMYTVKKGDSLSKIAKQFYGDAMKYPVIFEANTPMLKDPDKIYPGQKLRIPDVA